MVRKKQTYTRDQKDARNAHYKKRREEKRIAGLCQVCNLPAVLSLWGRIGIYCGKHMLEHRNSIPKRPREVMSLDRFLSVDPVRLAYAAALIDGEGHVGFSQTGRPKDGRLRRYPVVIIRMMDPECVLFMEETFFQNATIVTRKGFDAPVHSWQAVGRMAGAVLKVVVPYMKIKSKIEKAKLAIRIAEVIGTTGSNWDHVKDPELASKFYALQAEINKVKAPRGGYYAA